MIIFLILFFIFIKIHRNILSLFQNKIFLKIILVINLIELLKYFVRF
jgi:hypothetical protein